MNTKHAIAHETALQIMANVVGVGPQDAANLIIIEDNIQTAIERATEHLYKLLDEQGARTWGIGVK